MHILVVVGDPEDWTLSISGVELVSARSYLTEDRYSQMRRARVFNLCRSYRYQSVGYYVSLLAEARGHRPQPSVSTIEDMKLQALARLYSEDLDEAMEESLKNIRSKDFTLSIYFGQNVAKRYQQLSLQLFNLFPAPLLRANFSQEVNGWSLRKISPISACDIPEGHEDFVAKAAGDYFSKNRKPYKREQLKYDLAILYQAVSEIKPSNEKAIERFVKAAKILNMSAVVIDKTDVGRIAEFDGLFIRETTAVNHYTYRIARRAQAEGLVVIDEPESIVKCTNKVFLAQLLGRHRIPTPRTMILHKENTMDVKAQLGLPCILKQPDSSFSQGVIKVSSERDLTLALEKLLDRSDLIVAQEYVPTAFDWRVGVMDGLPLYVCKYHMAKNHWQIVKHGDRGYTDYGKIDTMPVEEAPRQVIETAVKAANLIGDGLYGVDLKQVDERCYVIEINDNPNIDAGFEDAYLKDRLYLRIMESFLRRIENRSTRSHTGDKNKNAPF